MRNVLKTLFFLFIVYSLLFIVAPSAQAQALGNEQLTNFSQAAGYGEASLPQVIGRIIKIALSLLGLAAVIIIIAGGFIWMSSGGNPEKITKAKKVITSALIGLLIIVFAYAMVSFIMGKLAGVTGIGSENGEGCTSGLCCATGLRCSVDGRCNISDSSCSLPSDAFRIKKIETAHGGLEQNYHQDVYLCSAVQPIFNSAVDSDVIQDLSNNGGLRIESGGDHMSGFWNVRENVLIFKHNDLFVENTTYQSYFPKAILNTQSKILQQCLAAGGCVETGSYFIWTFNTGDTVDDIPPEINSTYPIFDTEDPDYPDQNISRGSSIEVSFSESIDVTTVADENNHPLSANIWVAELDGEKGSVVQVLPSNNFRINSNGNGFRMYLEDGHLFNSFSWYRIHVEGIEDLCLNIMEEAIEWEFQTNDQASGISSYYPQGENACPDTDISVVFNAQMYDNLVRFEISGKDSFTFEMRPRELEPPYEKAVSGGVFKVSDPGSPIDNHFRVFTFNPYNNLQSNADYKVTVFTDLVIDQQGTLLSGTWNFSTATLETCLCSPWIARLDPEQGLRGDCITVYGRCFKGTGFQTAEPTKLEFILSETPTEAVIGGFGDNYITTVVPGVYLKGNRPKVQATITYQSGELTSNLAEFYVKSDEQANGPCLLSINPASGYSDETNVYLSGLRFGEKTGFSQVIFYNNVPTVYRTWSDAGGIDDALVPLGAEDGSVVVINAQGPSNGLPFDVLQHASGPGQVCRESVNCPNNPSYVCSEPVYHCLYKTSDTCRCCCNSSFNSCLSPLKCMANQGNCTGDARGLCCGCQNDAQCGGSLGCGVLDSNKCCYPRPQAIIRIPTGNNICLNTAVEVKFDQVMDRSSLNKDNIKLINLSNNENIDFNLIINEDNDNFIMYPTDCLLQPNTNYKVEVIGGVDGKGIRSEMGVSIKDNNYWSWQFITGTEDNLCQVDYISVSPNTAIVKSFNETVNYTAKGYDAENNIPVCVTEFFWDSGDVNIAMVNPSQGLQTVASPVGGQGEQTVNITAMVLGTLGTGQFTSILSPPVISGLSPNSGTNNPAIPTYVTIAGSGFGEMQKNSVVKFGDTAAKIGCNNWSDTEIVAIAPEGLTIGSDYLVTVTNPEQGMSNEKTFGVRNEFHPAICQIKPNKGETGTQIDIQGINFADEMAKVGKIDFGNVLQGGAELKKDSDKILSWSNKDIKIKAPEVPEQKPQITVYVPSPIETGNPLKPSNPVSFYKQPIINSITPDNGPKQTWVTVKGQNFGSIPGKVYFQYNKTDYLAEELPDYCPDIWTDQMIIVAAPESLPTVPSDKDFYQTRVYVKTAYDIESNSIDWQVNKNPLPPALCQISPNKDLQSNDLVEVKGDRFNLTLTELARRLIFSQDKSAASLEWTSDTEINKAVLPLGIVSGDVFIEKDLQTNCREICHGLFFAGICVGTLGPDVKCDEIQIRSNPLYIAVKALKVLDLPRVIEDSACEQSFQSPSPRHLSSQGCSNTLILARFNMKMNPDTLVNSGNVFVHPNVIIQKCNSGSEEFHDQSCNVSVNGSISLAEFGNQGFVFTPSSLLDKNYWYKVTLKSGAAGIKDGVNGNQLDGNKNGFEEGSPDDDYFWYFKIKGQGEICLADRVEISEQVPDGGIKGVIIKPGIRNYAALPIGPDCQILNPISFIWAWNSTNQAVATAAGGIPSYTAVATAVDLGETKIQATVTPLIGGPTTGSSDLIVATYPSVVDNFPSDGQTDVCRNTVISATFNQEMDPGSFQNNISISPATPSFGISFSPDKKTVNLETGLLDSDSTYTVMIKGPAGVKSKYGVKMSADYSWTFTPGELCQLSAVEIIPQTMSFTSTGSKKSLTAYAKDDKGYEIQGIPGVYTWTWSWESSDTAVVSVKESVSKNETATAQTRNGRAQIVATASIIDSNPVVSVSGQAQADVFLCEVPWIFKDSFGPGSSPNTQFKLSYCRGDYPQGVYVAENIGWSSSNQRHSRVGIAKDESYTGSDSLLIHQDPNEPYPGICSLAACNGTGTGSWPNSYVYAPYCSWQTGSPNKCNLPDDPNCGTCEFNEGAGLGWPWSNRVMWARIGYNTTGFNLKPGQEYTFTFFYKGRLASSSSILMCYGLGWCGQTFPLSYCISAGNCTEECQYINESEEVRISHSDDSCCRCRFQQWPYQTEGYPAIGLGSIPAGNYPEWTRYAKTFQYTKAMANTLNRNGNLINEVGMSIGYNDTGALGTDVYIDDVQFQKGSLQEVEINILPELTAASIQGNGDLIKEFLFSVGDLGDVIGLKVFNNPKRLTPLNWYKENVPNPGSPKSFLIDNYFALQEGRTVYVGATNVDGSDVYTYIYLISYNDGAKPETIKIFNQLLDNWEFNINFNNYFENKAKIQNDLLRIYDFQEIKSKLYDYYQVQKRYPDLGTGTYVTGQTNSKWPSWQNTLGKSLGQSLPIDPVNNFNTESVPCAGCPNNPTQPNYQCQGSCYNSLTGVFDHPNGSHVYQYYAPQNTDCLGRYYRIKLNLEYGSGGVTWKGWEDIITLRPDSSNTFNYVYSSPGTPVCGDREIQCGEECDCGGSYQSCCSPSQPGYCPGTKFPGVGFIPNKTCESMGYESDPTGFFECNDCIWDGSSCKKKIDGKPTDEPNGPSANCHSGWAYDGVCCNVRCDGLCKYCGDGYGGIAGTCHTINKGNDPRGVCNDTSGCLTGNCDGAGACADYHTSGDRNCPECQTCDGAFSGTCLNKTDNTRDTVGLGLCQAVCKKCSGGDCVNQTAAEDLFDHCSTDTQQQIGGNTYYCQSRSKDGNCNGSSGVCKDYGSWSNINQDQICSGEDHCGGDTYYAAYTCNAGACNFNYNDIGCCQGSKCASDKYCNASNHTCTFTPACQNKVSAGFGTTNVTAGTDPGSQCTAAYNACSGTNKIGPDGYCNGSGACNTGGLSSGCATAGTCETGGGCSAGSCVAVGNVTAGTDPGNQCTAAYNACSGTNKIGPDGYCNGSGACNTGGLSFDCATTGTCETGGGCSDGICVAVGYVPYYGESVGCTDICKGCDGSGNCVFIPDGTPDTDGGALCNQLHHVCNGGGVCWTPTEYKCFDVPGQKYCGLYCTSIGAATCGGGGRYPSQCTKNDCINHTWDWCSCYMYIY